MPSRFAPEQRVAHERDGFVMVRGLINDAGVTFAAADDDHFRKTFANPPELRKRIGQAAGTARAIR